MSRYNVYRSGVITILLLLSLSTLSMSLPTKSLTQIVSGFIAGSIYKTITNVTMDDLYDLSDSLTSFNKSEVKDIFFSYARDAHEYSLIHLLVICLTIITTTRMFTNRRPQISGRYVAQSNDSGNLVDNNPPEPDTTTNEQSQIADDVLSLTTVPKHFKSKYDNLYGTPMYVGQLQFPSSAVSGQVLSSYSFLNLVNNANITRLFRDYRYVSFDIKFTVNVTGNAMSSGALIMSCKPSDPVIPGSYAYFAGAPAPQFPLQSICALPYVLMDVSKQAVYEIEMPFTYYATFLTAQNYSSTYPYNVLNVVVLHPYLPSSGTAPLNIELYASLINIRVCEKQSYLAQGLRAESLISIGEHHDTIMKMDNISNSSLPVNVTGDALTVPMSLNPLTGIAKAISTMWSFGKSVVRGGMDNPSDTRNPRFLGMRIWQKISSIKNVLDVQRFALDPSVLYTVTPLMKDDMRLSADEMSIEYFRNRWSWNNSLSFNAATPTGKLLLTLGITPLDNSASNVVANPRTSSFMDFASFATFWRGTIKFRVLFGSNKFRQCKILAAIHYGIMPNDPSLGDVATGKVDPRSVPHVVYDIGGGDDFIEIDVPYKSPFEVSRVITDPSSPFTTENTIGTLALYLVSPVTVSAGTSSIVYYSTFTAWGDDFQIYNHYSYPSTYAQSSLKMEFPSPTLGSRLHTVAMIASLKELLIQPVLYGTYTLASTASVPAPPIVLPISPIFLTNCPVWSYAMNTYAGCSGSLRLVIRYTSGAYPLQVNYYNHLGPLPSTVPALDQKISLVNGMNSSVNGTTSITTNPILNPIMANWSAINNTASDYVSTMIPTPTAILDNQIQKEAIVEIPDTYALYKTQPTLLVTPNYNMSTPYDPRNDLNMPMVVIQPLDNVNNSSIPTTFQVYFMAGDDFKFFWFNGGPSVAKSLTFTYGTPATTVLDPRSRPNN